MGRNISQVKYKCNDGCDYGSCNKTNVFVFIFYRGSDTFTLYHKRHIEDAKAELEYITGGEDDVYLTNLIKALTNQDHENPDEEISEEITKRKLT